MSGTAPTRALVPGLFALGKDGRPTLLGSRCASCGEHAFPARHVCSRCKRPTMAAVELGGRATLLSFTVSHVAPSGWRAPYLQAYVELPQGCRVFTLLADEVEPRADALEIGMPMELVVEAPAADPDALTYKFRPAAG